MWHPTIAHHRSAVKSQVSERTLGSLGRDGAGVRQQPALSVVDTVRQSLYNPQDGRADVTVSAVQMKCIVSRMQLSA